MKELPKKYEALVNISEVGFKLRKLTPMQEMAYDIIMSGRIPIFSWPRASGKTYLYKVIKEDLARIDKVMEYYFEGE